MLLYLRHGVQLLLLERVLWAASIVIEALVAIRFVYTRLVKMYPFFVTFLVIEVITNVIGWRADITSRGYAETYRNCELILTVFRIGAVVELYERICNHFPGIGSFRGFLASILILLAATAAVFTMRPDITQQWAFPQTIANVILRYEGEVLAGTLFLTWIFLRFVLSIRQPFRPNVLTHWTISTIYFGAIGVAFLAILITGGGNMVYPINCLMQAGQIACFIAWFCLMRPSGEELPAFPRFPPGQAEAIQNYARELMSAVKSLPSQISARQGQN